MLSGYDIFDFVTNIGMQEMSNEKIIKLYRKRSDVENFLRETKKFDLIFPSDFLETDVSIKKIVVRNLRQN